MFVYLLVFLFLFNPRALGRFDVFNIVRVAILQQNGILDVLGSCSNWDSLNWATFWGFVPIGFPRLLPIWKLECLKIDPWLPWDRLIEILRAKCLRCSWILYGRVWLCLIICWNIGGSRMVRELDDDVRCHRNDRFINISILLNGFTAFYIVCLRCRRCSIPRWRWTSTALTKDTAEKYWTSFTWVGPVPSPSTALKPVIWRWWCGSTIWKTPISASRTVWWTRTASISLTRYRATRVRFGTTLATLPIAPSMATASPPATTGFWLISNWFILVPIMVIAGCGTLGQGSATPSPRSRLAACRRWSRSGCWKRFMQIVSKNRSKGFDANSMRLRYHHPLSLGSATKFPEFH